MFYISATEFANEVETIDAVSVTTRRVGIFESILQICLVWSTRSYCFSSFGTE